MSKKILGLDLGTNSLGWALIDYDFDAETGKILGMGSRVVPMSNDRINNFQQGNSMSRTADRRLARSQRRNRQRYKQRRERLLTTLNAIGWLPADFSLGDQINASTRRKKEMMSEMNTGDAPDDWVVYYLRDVGLKKALSKEELARILIHFNQRRGFKSNRKTDSDQDKTEIELIEGKPKSEEGIKVARVLSVEDTGETFKGNNIYNIELEDGEKGSTYRKNKPDWEGLELELFYSIKRSKKGERITFKLPEKGSWKQRKEAVEQDIQAKELHPGQYFFWKLIQDPNFRIRDNVIDRSFYYEELKAILHFQKQYHPELNQSPPVELVQGLYQHNAQKQRELKANDLIHLLMEDVIYYQRDLKSQKSQIRSCSLEIRKVQDKKGLEMEVGPKVVPASHPLFQEFRIWKTINNLNVIALREEVKGKIKTDVDVTSKYLTPETKASLFEFLDAREQASPKQVLEYLGLSAMEYRLNFPQKAKIPGNETKNRYRKVFNRFGFEGNTLLDRYDSFYHLWHMDYSIANGEDFKNALIRNYQLPAEVASGLAALDDFPSRHSRFSAKALGKLLPLLRTGTYWDYQQIKEPVKARIAKLIDGEVDPEISNDLRDKLSELQQEEDYQGLNEAIAAYVVYGRFSERSKDQRVSRIEDIEKPKQTSLRNPVVEQLLNETIELVKAIWKQYGYRPDEIRIELARDLRMNADERKKADERRQQNQEDRQRAQAILRSLKLGNPDSPTDIDRLLILEDNGNYAALSKSEKLFKKETEPTPSEIEKYRLWIEQHCLSPYTGRPIQLSKLYSREYDIEHIVPRSRLLDDSRGNKVIAERWVNTEKGNKTARVYIKEQNGAGGLLDEEAYINHVGKYFFGKKRKHLLSEEVPEGFISRQLNDTRYITKKAREYLSQFVGAYNVRPGNGTITTELKNSWGLNQMMKEILIPRYERLEKITGDQYIQYRTDENGRRKIDIELYDKRIDHRHHALDALVVACTTTRHVQYLSNLNAHPEYHHLDRIYQKLLKSEKRRDFKLPWSTFIPEAKNAMERIVVSHKNRHRILNKGVNQYYKYHQDPQTGEWIKKLTTQNNKNLWSVRQPLHKETIAGLKQFRSYYDLKLSKALEDVAHIADHKVREGLRQRLAQHGSNKTKLRQHINLYPLVDKEDNPVKFDSKIKMWEMEEKVVSRVKLDKSFDLKKIDNIAEYDNQHGKGIKGLLKAHLAAWEHKPAKAFEGEGLEELAKKAGKPITTVSTFEPIGNKYPIREGQYVEAAKGTNLFFIIKENKRTKTRKDSRTIGLIEALESMKAGMSIVDDDPEYRQFLLSPEDLVYVPEPEEDPKTVDWENLTPENCRKIYKMVSCTEKRAHFLPHAIAKPIVDGKEFRSDNKVEKDAFNQTIKLVCIKLRHDRLGNVRPA